MKKIIGTLALFLCLSSLGYGQFTKGKFMTGGNFSGGSSTFRDDNGIKISKAWWASFFPQAGYFFADNFAAGVGLELGRSALSSDGNSQLTISDISFGPFTRYYFNKFYGQASFHIGSAKYKNDTANFLSYESTTGWSLAAGYSFMASKRVGIEPQIGYKSYAGAATLFGADGILFLSVGSQVYLGK